MPAYRSSAEAEIRDAVVAKLREKRPGARIIHEINVSTYGPNRIDLIAVDREEIIAVEIKSARDKLDRLDAQVKSMRLVAHHTVAALHEKFLVEQKTNAGAAHYERDGEHFLKRLPDDPRLSRSHVWVYPEIQRCIRADYDNMAIWKLPTPSLCQPLPSGSLGMLWRDELYGLCGSLGVSTSRRSDMASMTAALRWACTGKELTQAVCATLRARQCTEADPAVEGERIAA